jgi:hypothetical protein
LIALGRAGELLRKMLVVCVMVTMNLLIVVGCAVELLLLIYVVYVMETQTRVVAASILMLVTMIVQ